jgi:predicted RNA-binding protein YlqC (UPF0109 family)
MPAPGRALGSSPAPDLGELVRYLTINLVDKPDEVVVSLVQERDADVYEIEVGDDDLGQIIGKGGKTARAIRSVVSAAAPRTGKRTLVEILE